MGTDLYISDDKLDSFVEALQNGSDGLDKVFLGDCVDAETNISVNYSLHDAFNSRNIVVSDVLSGVQSEISNLTNLKTIFNETDDSTATSYGNGTDDEEE